MGIDLEPFKALQQNKGEGERERLVPSGREKNDESVKWEMNEGRAVRVSTMAQQGARRVTACCLLLCPDAATW